MNLKHWEVGSVGFVRHADSCNMWEGCGQCEGPDTSRECTCGLRAAQGGDIQRQADAYVASLERSGAGR